MKRRAMAAVRQGMVHSITYTRQLRSCTEPMYPCGGRFGITAQATRAAKTDPVIQKEARMMTKAPRFFLVKNSQK